MQAKWRAPACYVGVAVICALYLSVVPGIRFTDICAGAGLGAALMWAINEWETGRWKVALPFRFALLPVTPAVAATTATQTQPVQAAPVAAPEVQETAPSPVMREPEPQPRVDSGVATPETLEKWEIDEKEPSWDPSALAETWEKLRRELASTGPKRAATVATDLPRSAQLARGLTPGPLTATLKSAKAMPANSNGSRTAHNPGATGTGITARSYGNTPARPVTAMKPAASPATARPTGAIASALAATVPSPSGSSPKSATGEPTRVAAALLRPPSLRPR